jgi:hypothetical protein
VRLARACLWPLLLVLLAEPAGAQAYHSAGQVRVIPNLQSVDLGPTQYRGVYLSVDGTIRCLVPQPPEPVVVAPSRDVRVDFSGGESTLVWRMTPSRWELPWSTGSLPGEYRIQARVKFSLYTYADLPSDVVDVVAWKGSDVGNTLGRCNTSYSWAVDGPPLQIRVHAEPQSLVQFETAPPPEPMPMPRTPQFTARSETPMAARATLGAALAMGLLGAAALVSLRIGRPR